MPSSAEPLAFHAEAAVRPAFEEVYAECFDMVWCAARRLGVAEASLDDVVQDVFVVLHRRLADFDPRRPLKSWVYGIVVRVVRDYRRSYRRKDAPCVPHAVDSQHDLLIASPAPAPSEIAEREEAWRLLSGLLDQLDDEKREVLVLSELMEMTVPEIAEALAVNVNTVYSRLRAARKAFDEVHARHRARTERTVR